MPAMRMVTGLWYAAAVSGGVTDRHPPCGEKMKASTPLKRAAGVTAVLVGLPVACADPAPRQSPEAVGPPVEADLCGTEQQIAGQLVDS